MYAVKRVDVSLKQVKCACAKGVFGTTWHAIGPFSRKVITHNHFRRWCPSWPLCFPANDGVTRPGKTLFADTNTVSQRSSIGLHQVQKLAVRVDNNCPGVVTSNIVHNATFVDRGHLFYIRRVDRKMVLCRCGVGHTKCETGCQTCN